MTKRLKLINEDDSVDNQLAIAGPSNQNPILRSNPKPPKIFKLDIDCFDEIFEYLSLKDLHSISQTCKTMQKVAGEYFKRNYSSAEVFVKNDGIYTLYSDNNGIIKQPTPISNFNKFVTCITHSSAHSLKPLRYLRSHFREFESLKQICFLKVALDEEKGECLKNIWPQIEKVLIKNCHNEGDFYENVLIHCNRMKRLHIQQTTSRYWFRLEPNVRNPWFHRTYPNLEHLELIPTPTAKDLDLLFANNLNLQSLSMNTPSIWYTRDGLVRSNIHLELLEIKDAFDFKPISKQFSDLINQLYKLGFFRRLTYYTYDIEESSSIHIASLPALEKLCTRKWTGCFSLTQLTNLKELAILNDANSNDMKIMASNLVNLQRVYIGNATIDDVMPFIRLAPKVTKIKVIPKDEASFNGGTLKLLTLNRQREKLFGAQKITIFVPDNIFLKTKWNTEHGDTNLGLIEIRRSDSYEWNQDF